MEFSYLPIEKNTNVFWSIKSVDKPSSEYINNNIKPFLKKFKANLVSLDDIKLVINTNKEPFNLIMLNNDATNFSGYYLLDSYVFNGVNYVCTYTFDVWTTYCELFEIIEKSNSKYNLTFYTHKTHVSKANFEKVNMYHFNGSKKPFNCEKTNFTYAFINNGTQFQNDFNFQDDKDLFVDKCFLYMVVVHKAEQDSYGNWYGEFDYTNQIDNSLGETPVGFFGLVPLNTQIAKPQDPYNGNNWSIYSFLTDTGSEVIDVINLPFCVETICNGLTNYQNLLSFYYDKFCYPQSGESVYKNKGVLGLPLKPWKIEFNKTNSMFVPIYQNKPIGNLWDGGRNKNLISTLLYNGIWETQAEVPQIWYYIPQLAHSLKNTLKYNNQACEVSLSNVVLTTINNTKENILPQLLDFNNYDFTLMVNAPHITVTVLPKNLTVGDVINLNTFDFWNAISSTRGASASFLKNYQSIINTSHKIMNNTIQEATNNNTLENYQSIENMVSPSGIMKDIFSGGLNIVNNLLNRNRINENYQLEIENAKLNYSLNYGNAKIQALQNEQIRTVGNGTLNALSSLLLSILETPSRSSILNIYNDFYNYGYEIDDYFDLNNLSFTNNLFWFYAGNVDLRMLLSILEINVSVPQIQKEAWETQIKQGVRVWKVKPFKQNVNNENDLNNWNFNDVLI